MSDAQKMWDSVFASVRAFFQQPAVKAYYEALAKENAASYQREQAALSARRAAEEAELSRKRSYDVWALNGGSNECIQFGINDGCKPECPVFCRGDCECQAENEAIFNQTA